MVDPVNAAHLHALSDGGEREGGRLGGGGSGRENGREERRERGERDSTHISESFTTICTHRIHVP